MARIDTDEKQSSLPREYAMVPSSRQLTVISSAILLAFAGALANVAVGTVTADEPGRLEFRILADEKHDAEAVVKIKAADGDKRPPAGYRWARLGSTLIGTALRIEADRVVVAGAVWKDDEFARRH